MEKIITYKLNDAIYDILLGKLNAAMKLIADPATWAAGIAYLFQIRKMRNILKYYDPL